MAQARAQVGIARVDLERTTIRSPIAGTVLQRAVDVGQTVAASLSAPTIFTIAQDLSKMEVRAAIDEADVGKLREGLEARFTVDAHPGREFVATIFQIRSNPNVTQNVVTYDAILRVDNPDGKLRPGMTASVRIVTEKRENVLRVPNAALRFKPPAEIVLAQTAGHAAAVEATRRRRGRGRTAGGERVALAARVRGAGRARRRRPGGEAANGAGAARAARAAGADGWRAPAAARAAAGRAGASRVYKAQGEKVVAVPFRPGHRRRPVHRDPARAAEGGRRAGHRGHRPGPAAGAAAPGPASPAATACAAAPGSSRRHGQPPAAPAAATRGTSLASRGEPSLIVVRELTKHYDMGDFTVQRPARGQPGHRARASSWR